MSENNKDSSNQQQHSTKSMLRPSLLLGSSLSSSSNSTTTPKDNISETIDKASNKNNPFLKENFAEIETTESEKNNASGGGGGDNIESKTHNQNLESEKTDPLTMLSKTKSLPKSNLFSIKTSACNDSLGFVFGQNVHERVVVDDKNIPNSNNGSSEENNKDEDNQNSTSLFASAILKNSSFNNNKTSDTSNKSLTEVAREYEESRAQKRKYEEVETFTGEENEKNIIDINCKLFAFVNSNWEERGRGNLRLNDSKEEKNVSRVVFRTSGNLRLLVNTKVWPDMIAERPSPKSLRLTAMDNNGQVKIFLIMSRPDDISSVFNALTKRIQILKDLLDTSNQGHDITEEKQEDQENNSDNKTSTADEPSPKKTAIEKEN